jgi:hypothetical protein
MNKFKNSLKNEFWKNISLFLCGVFLVYIAAFDGALFHLVAFDVTNRLLVTLGTILAAALPMFFAIGSIKQSVLFRRETIYFYEKMLKHWVFWLVSGIFCFFIAAIKFIQPEAFIYSSILTGILCCVAGAYLVYYSLILSGKISNLGIFNGQRGNQMQNQF